MDKVIDAKFSNKLGTLTQAEADAAAFGIVKVDGNGKILLYNKYESELSNLPNDTVIGKNFFTEVAICANNRIFYGKFKEGMVTKNLDTAFNYVFTYRMKPTNVLIHLYYDKTSDTNWIFVKLR
ncbi:PAS domain-containing protein [Leptospira vanthielii]|uniref:Photoactive yellow protein n=1 Tax=Leptospira vanthielii serovar Holland str. Waz Holland = ATCC 700522 TaxID=1218591 RepID=N1W9K0_9LEPT|nr:PAS domain-containing protein [Leptospira vanthielii]EMY70115.1 putative photoactive yellow protein [Leptospira vanthielii serovar Holland str. Waz Holland = ATCC 700522]